MSSIGQSPLETSHATALAQLQQALLRVAENENQEVNSPQVERARDEIMRVAEALGPIDLGPIPDDHEVEFPGVRPQVPYIPQDDHLRAMYNELILTPAATTANPVRLVQALCKAGIAHPDEDISDKWTAMEPLISSLLSTDADEASQEICSMIPCTPDEILAFSRGLHKGQLSRKESEIVTITKSLGDLHDQVNARYQTLEDACSSSKANCGVCSTDHFGFQKPE